MDALKYCIKTFIMESGERYCLLVDTTTGIPLFYPNLYVTTQIRNNSLSVSAMETALTSINVFLSYCDDEELDLEKRFIRRVFFTLPEIDGIRDCCQKRFKKERAATSSARYWSHRNKNKSRRSQQSPGQNMFGLRISASIPSGWPRFCNLVKRTEELLWKSPQCKNG